MEGDFFVWFVCLWKGASSVCVCASVSVILLYVLMYVLMYVLLVIILLYKNLILLVFIRDRGMLWKDSLRYGIFIVWYVEV